MKIVRAGSYNVFGGRMSPAAPIGAALSSLRCDVLGLQECPNETFAELVAEQCGMQHHFCSNMMLASREPLRDVVSYELIAGRSITRALTEIDGLPIAIYVAHISWDSRGDRDARLIVDTVLPKETCERMVLMGNWNDERFSTQITTLEEKLTDGWADLGWYPGERTSWPAFGWYGGDGAQLIDMVLFNRSSGGRAIAGDVVNLTPLLSDHKPIWVDVAFPVNPTPPAPQVTASYVLDSTHMDVEFDRPLDAKSVAKTANYEITFQGIYVPVVSAELLTHAMVVRLTTEPMTVGRTYRFKVTGIVSDVGGVMEREGVESFIRVERNLLENGSANDGTASWSVSGGFTVSEERENQRPYTGAAMFAGGPKEKFSEATQTIDVSVRRDAIDKGRVLGAIEVFMCTGFQKDGDAGCCRPYDEGEIFVEMLGEAGEQRWWRSSGRRDTLWWQRFSDRFPVVPGTRTIKVHLRAYRKSENGESNDALFDMVSLSLNEMEIAGRPINENMVKNGLAQSGDLSEWKSTGDFQTIESYDREKYVSEKVEGGCPLALTGHHLFHAGRSSRHSSAEQTFNLGRYASHIDRKNTVIQWGAAVRSWYGEATAEVTLTCLDSKMGILSVASTGRYSGAEWHIHRERVAVPPGTRWGVITMSAEVDALSEKELGAFFDGIYALPCRR